MRQAAASSKTHSDDYIRRSFDYHCTCYGIRTCSRRSAILFDTRQVEYYIIVVISFLLRVCYIHARNLLLGSCFIRFKCRRAYIASDKLEMQPRLLRQKSVLDIYLLTSHHSSVFFWAGGAGGHGFEIAAVSARSALAKLASLLLHVWK